MYLNFEALHTETQDGEFLIKYPSNTIPRRKYFLFLLFSQKFSQEKIFEIFTLASYDIWLGKSIEITFETH